MLQRMALACSRAGVTSQDLSLLRDGLFQGALANYPYPELHWLDLSYQKAMAALPSPAIKLELANQLLAHNKEALQRVTLLAAGNEV
ncbi:hypothetical protein HaLaN_33022 [Haematococcus lacustris]|uniref:Uncharacterized protein n=1 Tax=Haematococcus lacustris TaxID=44745 RepID=A0A6A0AP42_HAELA|nr:hypothetical protein HaLaN_33022 [Haematococcus lacustris]